MRTRFLPILLAVALLASQALATWSIVVVNRRTGEVCVASATCIENFNLRNGIGVIAAEVGCGATQSLATSAITRREIHDLMLLGVPPQEILDTIAVGDPLWPARQIGLVDLSGRAVTYSGGNCGPWYGGVTGEVGDFVYAIQGNVLTGAPVVLDCETAFRNTNGDMGQRVMAAMEAAMLMGGDGRCSCNPSAPESCGVPPPNFTKSAHVTFMVIARPGEEEICTNNGCAGGDFYLAINKAGLTASDPDPVLILRQEFDAWRAGLAGRPDAVESAVWPPATTVTAGAPQSVFFDLDLADVDGVPLQNGGATVTMVHDPRSAGLATLQNVTDNGNGSYTVEVQPGAGAGLDLLRFVVDDGIHAVTLWPPARLLHRAPAPAPVMAGTGVAGLDAFADVAAVDLSADGLTAWFIADRGAGREFLTASRAGSGQPFGPPAAETLVGLDARRVTGLRVSADGLRALFTAVDGPGGVSHVYAATRATLTSPFEPTLQTILDSGLGEAGLALSANELELVFASRRSGNWDLYRATRLSPEARFFAPERLDALSTADDETGPVFEQGDTRLVFTRRAASGVSFLQSAERAEEDDLFTAATAVAGIAPAEGSLAQDSDPLDGALWVVGPRGAARALAALARPTGTLAADRDSLSVGAGGTVSWTLDAGPAFADAGYRLLAGAPGAEALGNGIVLPFSRDRRIEAIIKDPANSGLLPGTVGNLDAQGRAAAQWILPAGAVLDPNLIGRSFIAAFVTARAGARFVSEPQTVRLEP